MRVCEVTGSGSGQARHTSTMPAFAEASAPGSSRPLAVLALVESPSHVCYRYRLEAFASMLAERGLMLTASALKRGTLLRAAQLFNARRNDLVILQRKLLPAWQLAILRTARALVYDVDDAMFQRDSFHPKGPTSRKLRCRFSTTVRLADAVIAGNGYLKQSAALRGDSSRVFVVPTCVEPSRYWLSRQVRRDSDVKLAWIGSASTLRGLELVQPHLAAATRRLPGLEVRVICDRPIELAGIRLALRRWSMRTETDELADCDIGFSWLPDDSWSRGKCGLKILQYMAAGLPVVANPVGMNGEMVVPGRTGFLASTPEQWAEAVFRLAADPELRRAMGRAGRQLVERRYSTGDWGPRLAAILEGVARGSGIAGGCRSGCGV